MARAYCSRDCFDNIVPLEVLVVPDCRADRELLFHSILVNRAASVSIT